MIEIMEPYRVRPVRCLEVWKLDGWRLKLYGIAYGRSTPRPELVAAAREASGQVLPAPAITEDRYGVGFVGVHDGRDSNFVFVDWWAAENELHHHVFVSPHDDPAALVDQTGSGLTACVWDLAVISYERDAWIASVLANPRGPDLKGYLTRQMNADV